MEKLKKNHNDSLFIIGNGVDFSGELVLQKEMDIDSKLPSLRAIEKSIEERSKFLEVSKEKIEKLINTIECFKKLFPNDSDEIYKQETIDNLQKKLYQALEFGKGEFDTLELKKTKTGQEMIEGNDVIICDDR
ncbi:hypothetical protein KJ855_02575 [Patescibacteria group bacterium]|nr:hypothetical protein [Patescibacteria group bacterium]